MCIYGLFENIKKVAYKHYQDYYITSEKHGPRLVLLRKQTSARSPTEIDEQSDLRECTKSEMQFNNMFSTATSVNNAERLLCAHVPIKFRIKVH